MLNEIDEHIVAECLWGGEQGTPAVELGDLLSKAEIANVVVFLASNDASYMTGYTAR